MSRFRISGLSGIVFILTSATTALAAEPTLESKVQQVVGHPRFKHAHWGILVADQTSGEALYSHFPDAMMTPASTTKLFSTAAALDAFGADHRFETPIYRRGEIVAGAPDADGKPTRIVQGDLILVASGDLTFGGRTDEHGKIAYTNSDHTYADFLTRPVLTKPDPLAGIQELARQVAASGIREVTGDVLIDDRLFARSESTGSGPIHVTPIVVNDNVIDVIVAAGSAGRPAVVDWRPKGSAIVVDAQVTTTPAGSKSEVTLTEPAPGRFVVRGKIAADEKPIIRIHEVDDATAFARSLLIDALQRAGVHVQGSALEPQSAGELPAKDAYKHLERVAVLTSPPFSEEIKLILKVSHNLHASTLPLLVAAKHGKRTLREGLRLQREFLVRQGVPTDGLSFGGGAGGSRSDCVSARAATELLRAMARRPDFAAYRAGLPILGEDGTLASALDPASPARGKAFAKTGTYTVRNDLNDKFLLTSKALAGYLQTAKGRDLVFAFYVNNAPLDKHGDKDDVGKALGKLCEIFHLAF
jgi:D-alanyl-D-alanine carboxypeptidase/D-alanyl-D-alanine-endopeptidase (penicillin-binding protein 4)